jgi:opacity protein-like surface antigen
MMRAMIGAAVIAAAAMPAGATAQTVTLEQLARRIDALERENAELKAEVGRLAGTSPQPGAPAAPAEPSAAPPAMTAAVSPALPLPGARDPWEGPYVGIHVGLAGTRYRIEADPPRQLSPDGMTYGGQFGWRWQNGALVTGLELEVSAPNGQDGTFPFSTTFDTTLHGRIKGQLGVAHGPLLLYATGGLQVSRVHILDPGGAGISQSGFLYGVGAAARLGSRVALELEAVQADLGLIPNVAAVSNRSRTLNLRLNYQLP